MSLKVLINKYYEQLNDNDLHVVSFNSHNMATCKGKTVMEIASNCNVS